MQIGTWVHSVTDLAKLSDPELWLLLQQLEHVRRDASERLMSAWSEYQRRAPPEPLADALEAMRLGQKPT